MSGQVEDTFSEDGPECPYCAHVHRPRSNDNWEWVYDERAERLKCDSCGRTSKMEVYTVWRWICEPVEETEDA